MKRLILLKLTLVLAMCMSRQVSAATIVLEASFQNFEVPTGSYIFVVEGEEVATGPLTQTMRATLLNQSAGDYTAVMSVCNDAACADRTTSYTVPDVPNIDQLTLKVTVSRD